MSFERENLQEYPQYLHSYGQLMSHFNQHFDSLTSYERGERFVQFAKRLVPHSRIGEKYKIPRLRQRSHDGGIDIIAESSHNDDSLCIQSKFTIRDVDAYAEVISKFQNFRGILEEEPTEPIQTDMFQQVVEKDSPSINFMIVTASDIEGIRQKYESSRRPSLPFYQELTQTGRLHHIAGPDLIPLLRQTYRKLHVLPGNFNIHFVAPIITAQDVYVGIISAPEIKRLYNKFGDALFLENVREFKGSAGDHSTFRDGSEIG